MSVAAEPLPGRRQDAVTTAAFIAVAGAWIALAPILPQPARGAGAVLALVAPGFALISALFGPADGSDWLSRATTSVMTSLALTTLLSLALDALGGTLTATAMAHVVGGATVALSAVVALAPGSRSATTSGVTPPADRRVIVAWVALAAVAAGIVATGLQVLPSPDRRGFFRLNFAGPWRYITDVVEPRGTTLTVPVQITNGYDDTRTFTVLPRIAGAGPWQRRSVTLAPGASWTGTVTGPAPKNAVCLNRATVALRDSRSRRGHVGNLTFYVKGADASCPKLPVQRF